MQIKATRASFKNNEVGTLGPLGFPYAGTLGPVHSPYLVEGINEVRSLSAELQHGLRRGLYIYIFVLYHPRNEDLAAELYLAPSLQKAES